MGYSKKTNKPAENGGKATADAPSLRRSFRVRPLAIAAIVVILAAAAFLVVKRGTGSGEQQMGDKDKKVQRQRHARPTQTPIQPLPKSPDLTKADEPKAIDPNARPTKVGEVVNGYVLLPNGKLHKRNGMKEIKVSEWNNKGRYQIFDSFTDNEFAALLTTKPGEMLIGGGVFPKDYEARFLKSLESPIIVSKDDPDDIKEVKRAVIQTRMEMKAALDRGENIREYVKAAYDEAQKLASYKDMISDELKKLRNNPDLTDADIDAFEEAANKVLDSKGIAPIKIGPLTRLRLRNHNK